MDRSSHTAVGLTATIAPHANGSRSVSAAIEDAGRMVLEARRVRDSLPIEEAARRALRHGGPSYEELVEKIRAQRAARPTDSAA